MTNNGGNFFAKTLPEILAFRSETPLEFSPKAEDGIAFFCQCHMQS